MNAGYYDLFAWALAWRSAPGAGRAAVYRVAAAQTYVAGAEALVVIHT